MFTDSLKNTILSIFYNLKNTIPSIFDNLKNTIPSEYLQNMDIELNWPIFSLILCILILSISTFGILMLGIHDFWGMSGLNVPQKIARVKRIVDRDPDCFHLTFKALAQYDENLDTSAEYRRPYNSFPPYSFHGSVDMHLSWSEQIEVATIMDNDLSTRRRLDFIISPEQGSIQFARSGKYIPVQWETIDLIAKAEHRKARERKGIR